MSPHTLTASVALATLALAAPAEAKTPSIHAHRGGSVLNGVPTFPENTMPAFENAAKLKFVIELDVKLSKDRVPVVIHDDTLDRTTNCAGQVSAKTAAQLAKCKADVLGSPGSGLKTKKVARPTVGIPRLTEVLALAKRTKATLNLEIKNLPTDKDFDPTPAFANRVMDVILASGLPKRQLIFENFIPPNLDVVEQRMPGATIAYLTGKGQEETGLQIAQARGYAWVSPNWPVSAAFVAKAQAAGFKVVPWTLDKRADVVAAGKAGVNALITDDPVMARKALT